MAKYLVLLERGEEPFGVHNLKAAARAATSAGKAFFFARKIKRKKKLGPWVKYPMVGRHIGRRITK